MIQISQLKLPCTHTQQELREKIERTLRIRPEELIEYSIEKQSISPSWKRKYINSRFMRKAHRQIDR